MEWAGVQWTHLAQDSNHWSALVNMVKNKASPENAGKVFGQPNKSWPYKRDSATQNFFIVSEGEFGILSTEELETESDQK